MEALMATLTGFIVFVMGTLVRLAVIPLVLVLLCIPFLVIFMGVRGAEIFWQRAGGLIPVGGLFWRAGLYYAPGHTWIKRNRTAVRVGLDDLAQRILVRVRSIELPPPGTLVHEGEVVSFVTCGSRRAAIASPVEGVVAAVNDAVCRDPSVIHRDPYAQGWLVDLTPANSRYTRLPRGKWARGWFREEATRLAQFLQRDLGIAAADGGEFIFPAPMLLGDEQWNALTKAFLDPERQANQTSSSAGGTRTRVPRPLIPFAAVLSAMAGGLYIVFLPVIGFAMLFGFLGLWAWQQVRRSVSHVAARFSGPARF